MKSLLLLLLAALLPAQDDPAAAAARAMREGRFADAERLYRALIKQIPQEPRLQLNLALALHSGKKYADANLAFAQFLKTNPPPGPVHLVAGLSLLKANQPCQAAPILEKAKRWQASEQVLTELADAYSACQRYPQAGAAYTEAAAKATANAGRLKRAAARAYWLARDYPAARPLFTALRPTFSNDPEFLYEFGSNSLPPSPRPAAPSAAPSSKPAATPTPSPTSRPPPPPTPRSSCPSAAPIKPRAASKTRPAPNDSIETPSRLRTEF